jgi:hypothetical protein
LAIFQLKQIFPKKLRIELGFELYGLFLVLSVIFSLAGGVLWVTSVLPRPKGEDFRRIEQQKHIIYSRSLIIDSIKGNTPDQRTAQYLQVQPAFVNDTFLEESGLTELQKNYDTVVNLTLSSPQSNSEKITKQIKNVQTSIKRLEEWEKKYTNRDKSVDEKPVYLFI